MSLGNRYVEGDGDSLSEDKKVYWFLGFLVSQFVGFVVSWFQSFLVSWFHWFFGFKVSEIHTFHSMFFERSWFHVTSCPYHVFWKILIPYSRCSRTFKTDLHDCSVPIFSQTFKTIDFQNGDILKNIFE